MKLFIDTTQSMMMIAFFDQNWKVVKSFNLEVQQKVEQMINFFNQLDQSFFKQLKTIYINLGPGSFTGSRIALLYVRTLAQMQKLPIFTCSTFELIQTQKQLKIDQPIYLYATNQKSYLWKNQNLTLVAKSNQEQSLDYLNLINNFQIYLPVFKLTELVNLKPIYGSNPQIGPIKKGN